MRRARIARQRQKLLMMTVEQEKAEVDILKGANKRMEQSLFSKDEEIKRLTDQLTQVGTDGQQ